MVLRWALSELTLGQNSYLLFQAGNGGVFLGTEDLPSAAHVCRQGSCSGTSGRGGGGSPAIVVLLLIGVPVDVAIMSEVLVDVDELVMTIQSSVALSASQPSHLLLFECPSVSFHPIRSCLIVFPFLFFVCYLPLSPTVVLACLVAGSRSFSTLVRTSFCSFLHLLFLARSSPLLILAFLSALSFRRAALSNTSLSAVCVFSRLNLLLL